MRFGRLAELQQTGTLVRTPSPAALTEVVEAAGGVARSEELGVVRARDLSMAEVGDLAHRAQTGG
ncbi:MAG TPA: hypothetical protein VK964_14810, partial [Nocardioidaceae bacterium]|nr:hypothetical protein [Nocardioidaceae bacterium]